MFGFFKKKGGEIPEEQQRQQRGAQEGQTRQDAAEVPQEFRALGQDFLPEELNILAVTGASGFGGGRSQGEKLWSCPSWPSPAPTPSGAAPGRTGCG